MLIYEIGPGGYWTGASIEIDANDGCPPGWTRATPPALAGGQFAVFALDAWEITSAPYSPPPPPVPASVTPLQMRKALRAAGYMPAVTAYLASADEEVVEAWEYATQIDHDNALIEMAATALGLTREQRDDLFRFAADS